MLAHRLHPRPQPVFGDELPAVGALVQHGDAVEGGLSRRFDEHERPALVPGVIRDADRVGDESAGQREIAL